MTISFNGLNRFLIKLSLNLAVILALLSVTQCSLITEPPAEIEYDLSENNQRFQIRFYGQHSNDGDNYLKQLIDVVSADLKRTGRFDVSETRFADALPNNEQSYISSGRISKDKEKDHYLVDFNLYLENQNNKISSIQSLVKPDDFRKVAHRVSDNIFHALLGVNGPFSTKLSFITVSGAADQRQYGLWISDADGFNKIPLYGSSEPIMSPSWSPNGKQIAFVNFQKDGRQGLMVYDLDKRKTRNLNLYNEGLVGSPAWSPNSEYLAFTYIYRGNADIYLLQLHADKITRLTSHKAIDTEAVWMPDSEKLVFTSDRSGSPQLYQMDINSDKVQRLTYVGPENAQANISPLGKRIAFIHRKNGRYHIALLKPDSKKLTLLTHGKEDESPSFSPGGSMILYSAISGNRSALKIVSSNGKINNKLATFDDVRQPVWSPLL